ncbi:HD domain protein [Gimesia maris]|uniref:HD domain-containing protein n=1 Tax=Gimesia maris TaxID=122 RepID=UPI00118A3CCA|nr:HD domain-containing protein [Gimesia maris]QDT79198.1 HD domain protein [Gimesia maris]
MPGNSNYRQPDFLDGSDHKPIHRIRCAVHGFIHYSSAERLIIDHWIFRRLRYIRQLALTELIYPGASHTRFEHSLGVMEMATRIFDRLAEDNGAQMEEVFQGVEVLREAPIARARQACRLAALLHDTGHSCFSHAAESVFHEGSDHESLTVSILKTPELLGDLLNNHYFEGCAELTASLIKPAPGEIPQVQILRDIVSGQVDADRSDYLLRDSHHCGVDYGRFDHRRLIECLTGWQDEGSGELVIGIKRDGIHSFESLILARYQMNTQVYYHRLRRIYDYYLEQFFRSLDQSRFDSPEKVLEWNDIKAMQELFSAAADQALPDHKWADRIVNRRHHRDVLSLDEGDGPQAVRRAGKVLEKIKEEFPDIDFIGDLPDQPFSIHKIARDDDRDGKLIDFPLLDRERKTSLGERSQILKALPPTFRVGYIFADVDNKQKRDEIANRCRVLRNEFS